MQSSSAAKLLLISSIRFKIKVSTHVLRAPTGALPLRAMRPGSTPRRSAGSGRHRRPCQSGRAAAHPLEDPRQSREPRALCQPLTVRSRLTPPGLVISPAGDPWLKFYDAATQVTSRKHSPAPQVNRSSTPPALVSAGSLICPGCPIGAHCLGTYFQGPFHS